MDIKKSILVGGLVVALTTPTTAYTAINDRTQQGLINGFKNYQEQMQLNINGVSQEEFNSYIKNVRQYNIDTIKLGGTSKGKATLYVKYYETKEQLREARRLASLIATEGEGLTQKEKVYLITQRIGEVLKYGGVEDSSNKAFSPYSAVAGGEGVCQAYARFADLVFQSAGIQSRFIEGKINETPHIWNAVNINGEWFGVDATSADEDEDETGKVNFAYVLMSNRKQTELGLKTTYSPVKVSNRGIQDFTGVGLISTKNKAFLSKEEGEVYSIGYQGDFNIDLVALDTEEYWVLGGNIITLNKGELKIGDKVLSKYASKEKVDIENSNLTVNGNIVYSPITLPESKVKVIQGDSKVRIKNGDKNYHIEYLPKRTNVYYKDKLLLQLLRY